MGARIRLFHGPVVHVSGARRIPAPRDDPLPDSDFLEEVCLENEKAGTHAEAMITC